MERVGLPVGYRLLTTAPGVWILVEVHATGEVVARYHGELNPEQVERDARKHDAREHTVGSAHEPDDPPADETSPPEQPA